MSHDSSLEPILRAVEPALRLVHERHLRQVLHFLIDRGRLLPTNPDLPFWLTRADLAAADVLPREVLSGTESRLLLVTDPDDRMIHDRPRDEQLRVYWRVLYRAAVMNAIDVKLASGALSAEACHLRLNRFGPAAAREIRFVLETEHLIAAEASDLDVYRTFAAVYLDLDHFTAHAVEEFFPALPHGHAVRAALAEDVAADALLAAARPAGAADPERETPADERWTAPPTAARGDAAAPLGGGGPPASAPGGIPCGICICCCFFICCICSSVTCGTVKSSGTVTLFAFTMSSMSFFSFSASSLLRT